jgi:hypothetical protein
VVSSTGIDSPVRGLAITGCGMISAKVNITKVQLSFPISHILPVLSKKKHFQRMFSEVWLKEPRLLYGNIF